MSDGGNRTSGAGTWITIVVTAVAVYVLSVGPMVALARTGKIPRFAHEAVEIAYTPLAWLTRVPGVAEPLGNYIDWWDRLLRKR